MDALALIPRRDLLVATEVTGEAWHSARAQGIGGSDLFDLIHRPLTLWEQKTGRRPPFEGNDLTELGQDMEESTLRRWAGDVGATLIRPVPFLRDRERPFWCGSLDALAVMPDGEVVVVDAKGTTQDWHSQVPERAYLQLDDYCHLTGLRTGYIAKRNAWGKRESLRVEFGPDEFDIYLAVMAEFWGEYIAKDVPPPPLTDDEKERTALARLASHPLVPKMDATAAMLVIEEELARCDREAKAATKRATELRTRVAEQMALYGVQAVTLPDGAVWRYVQSAGRVQYAQSSSPAWNESPSAESNVPSTPGCSRASASTTHSAAGSPPESTKSPSENSSSTRCPATRSSTPL